MKKITTIALLLLVVITISSCEKITTGTLLKVQVYSPEEVYLEIDDIFAEIIEANKITTFSRVREDRYMFITSKVDTYIHINADIVQLKANIRTIHKPKYGQLELIGEPEIN